MSNILKNINLASNIHKTYKLNILDALLEKNKDLAPQGSDKWLAERQYSVGGSEMSVITKDNPYSKLDRLVAQKIKFVNFTGNIATRWGKLFEDNTTRLCEILMDIDSGVKETGSLEGAAPNQRYSPDGLAVIKMVCLETDPDDPENEIEVEQYCIVLFEYKSPYSAIPNGTIPKHYMPQVKTGLCSIPITDFAIFINNMFRKCAFKDLGPSITYDTTFHDKDEKNKANKYKPLAFGLILFYQTKEQKKRFYKKYKTTIEYVEPTYDTSCSDSDSDSSDADNFFNRASNKPTRPKQPAFTDNMQLHKYIYSRYSKDPKQRHDTRDFGKSFYRNFNDILQIYDDKFFSIRYCDPHILAEYNNNTFLAAQDITMGTDDCKETLADYTRQIESGMVQTEAGARPLIGFLPWKLFKSDIIYEPRDPEYVNKYSDDIQSAIAIVKDIVAKETNDEKIKLFKHHFPKSRILKECGFDNSDNRQFLPSFV